MIKLALEIGAGLVALGIALCALQWVVLFFAIGVEALRGRRRKE